jgi:hypothetical protein
MVSAGMYKTVNTIRNSIYMLLVLPQLLGLLVVLELVHVVDVQVLGETAEGALLHGLEEHGLTDSVDTVPGVCVSVCVCVCGEKRE